MQISE